MLVHLIHKIIMILPAEPAEFAFVSLSQRTEHDQKGSNQGPFETLGEHRFHRNILILLGEILQIIPA